MLNIDKKINFNSCVKCLCQKANSKFRKIGQSLYIIKARTPSQLRYPKSITAYSRKLLLKHVQETWVIIIVFDIRGRSQDLNRPLSRYCTKFWRRRHHYNVHFMIVTLMTSGKNVKSSLSIVLSPWICYIQVDCVECTKIVQDYSPKNSKVKFIHILNSTLCDSIVQAVLK